MDDAQRAEQLISRVDAGERTRDLIEEIDAFCAETDDTELRTDLIAAQYTILDEAPGVFVSSYDSFFQKLKTTAEPADGLVQTYSFLADNPPAELRHHTNSLLTLLGHDHDLVQGHTCRLLSRLAKPYPGAVANATIGLRELLNHRNAVIRREACLALGAVEATEATDDIKRLRHDPEEQNREIAEWAIKRIETADDALPTWTRADLLSYDSREFEELIATLYSEMGYETTLTPPTRDGGYDLKATRDDRTLFLEVKRWDGTPVGVAVARELIGVGVHNGADRVTLVTSSTVTKQVREMEFHDNDGPPLAIVDGDLLMTFLEVHEIDPPV